MGGLVMIFNLADVAALPRWSKVECARGSLNQIPPHATFSGDVRLTPFYDIKELKTRVER